MLLHIITLISFKITRQIDESVKNSIFSFNFSFQAGGNYSIIINSEGNDRYLVLIMLTENVSKYWDGKDKNNPCNNISSNDNTYIIQPKEGKVNITRNIQNEGHYTIEFRRCSNSTSKDTVKFILMNPNSCFSADDQNLLKYYQYIIFTIVVFYSFWLMNWYT